MVNCKTKPALKSHITSEHKSGVSQRQLTLSLVFGECRADPEISQDTHEIQSLFISIHQALYLGPIVASPLALPCAFKASISYGTSTNGSLIRHHAVQLCSLTHSAPCKMFVDVQSSSEDRSVG